MYHARPLCVCAHSLSLFWPRATVHPKRDRFRMTLSSWHSINIHVISQLYRSCLLILLFALTYILSAQRFFSTGIRAGAARLAGPACFIASQRFYVQGAGDCHANHGWNWTRFVSCFVCMWIIQYRRVPWLCCIWRHPEEFSKMWISETISTINFLLKWSKFFWQSANNKNTELWVTPDIN